MEFKTRKIGVSLTEDEYNFVERLAHQDGISFNEELARMFHSELDTLMFVERHFGLENVRNVTHKYIMR